MCCVTRFAHNAHFMKLFLNLFDIYITSKNCFTILKSFLATTEKVLSEKLNSLGRFVKATQIALLKKLQM